jgi:ribosomal protein L35
MYNTVRTAAKRRKEEGKIKIKNKSSFWFHAL